MARSIQIKRGVRARKAVPFATGAEGDDANVLVDVRTLLVAEETAALSAARAYALAEARRQAAAHGLASQDLPEPKEGQPVYDLAVMAYIVVAATLDHDSPPEAPAPFFDHVGQVLELERDQLQLLYEAQAEWQKTCSPRRTTVSPEQYAGMIYGLAYGDEEAAGQPDPHFFGRLPRATLVSCMRIMARALVNSPTPRSPSSSSSSGSGAPDSSPPGAEVAP